MDNLVSPFAFVVFCSVINCRWVVVWQFVCVWSVGNELHGLAKVRICIVIRR